MDNKIDEKAMEKFCKEQMKNIINSNPQFTEEAKVNMNNIIEMAEKLEDVLGGCLLYAYLYNSKIQL